MKKKLVFGLSVVIFALIWELTARYIDMPLVIPTLTQIFSRTAVLISEQDFWLSVLYSLFRVFVSFFISVILGLFLGILSGLSSGFQTFISWPLSLIRSTPIVALIMIVLFWFPSDILPSFCAVLMTLPVMTDAVSKAFQNTDEKLLQAAKVFDFSFISKILYVYFPSSKPFILSTSKTVFSQSWKVVAAGEILSLPRYSLGTLIQDYRILLEPDAVFSLVLILSLVCFLSEKAFFQLLHYADVFLRHLWRQKIKSFKTQETSFVQDSTSSANTSSSDTKIEVSNLSFSYEPVSETQESFIFKDFSISFDTKKITCLSAPTGRGKTTLLKILSGIIPPSRYSGSVVCPKTSFIFQDSRLIPQLSVIQNIAIPLFSKMSKKDAYKKAFACLSKTGLQDKAFSLCSTLSGGENQKAQVARAFAFNAPVILMDEGTNSLDEESKEEIWNCIKHLLEENPRTLIFVTHDQAEAEKYADKISSF